MNRTFNQVQQFLKKNFPELNGKIQPMEYSPSELHSNLQSFVKLLQIIGMAWMIVGGDKLLKLVGYGTTPNNPLPNWYWQIQKNGMTCVFILFFFIPQILNSFASKDAFEIYLDGDLLFSRLDGDKMGENSGFPTAEQLIKVLKEKGLQHVGGGGEESVAAQQ